MALFVFVVAQVLNAAGLLLDLALLVFEVRTISEAVWRRPWLGLPIVLLQVVAIVALALHFWGKPCLRPCSSPF